MPPQSTEDSSGRQRRGGAGVVVLVLMAVLVIVGLVTWFLFTPEPRGKDQDPSGFIPADASVVMVLHLDRLIKKSDITGIIRENPQLLAILRAVGMQDPGAAADLTQAGFRGDAPIHVFYSHPAQGGQVIGVVVPIADREKFEQTLEDLEKRLAQLKRLAQFLPENTDLEITSADGVRGIFKENTVFAYTHQAMLVLTRQEPGADLRAMAIDLLKNGGGLAKSSEAFRNFQEADYDLGVWYHGQQASKGILAALTPKNISPQWRKLLQAIDPPADPEGGDPQAAADEQLEAQLARAREILGAVLSLDASLGVRFEDGRAVMEMVAWHNGRHARPSREVNEQLVEALPADALFAAAAAVDAAAIQKQIRGLLPEGMEEDFKLPLTLLENLSGMKLDELATLPGRLEGDLVVAIAAKTDEPVAVEPGGLLPAPLQYVLGLVMKWAGLDPAILDTLKAGLQGLKLPEMDVLMGLTTREAGSLKDPLGKMEKIMSLVGVESVTRGQAVFLATTSQAKAIRETGQAVEPLPPAQRAMLAGNQFAGYLHIAKLARLAGQLPAPMRHQLPGGLGMLLDDPARFENFQWLAIAVRSDASTHRVTFALHFKDRAQNSLRNLISWTYQQARNIENAQEPPGPEEGEHPIPPEPRGPEKDGDR